MISYLHNADYQFVRYADYPTVGLNGCIFNFDNIKSSRQCNASCVKRKNVVLPQAFVFFVKKLDVYVSKSVSK